MSLADIHPVIWLAVALLVIREVWEKRDWWRKRKQPKKWIGPAVPVDLEELCTPSSPGPHLRLIEARSDEMAEVEWGRRTGLEEGQIVEDSDEYIPFLDQNRDYALWLKLVRADIDPSVTAWIVSQPDCPNAVAAEFVRLIGADIYGETEESGMRIYEAIKIICQRDGVDDFAAETMADPVEEDHLGHEWSIDRQALLASCEEAARRTIATGGTTYYSVPRRLLSVKPTGPIRRTEYELEDTIIC